MRLIGRLVVVLLSLIVLAAAVYGGSRAVDWVQSTDTFGLLSSDPEQPVELTTIHPYTKEVAGKRWFHDYFTTMVFPTGAGAVHGESLRLTRWERRTVTVKLLNDPLDTKGYLRQLLRRLGRLQGRVDFRLAQRDPLITVEFLGHAAYVQQYGSGSVGTTRTRYFQGSPGLIRARIAVDVGVQDTPDEVRSTLIHELTHAIGAGGHFSSTSDRRRSVMYEANSLTGWSQNDAAVIRTLYSSYIRSGMTRAEARAGLKRYARADR